MFFHLIFTSILLKKVWVHKNSRNIFLSSVFHPVCIFPMQTRNSLTKDAFTAMSSRWFLISKCFYLLYTQEGNSLCYMKVRSIQTVHHYKFISIYMFFLNVSIWLSQHDLPQTNVEKAGIPKEICMT